MSGPRRLTVMTAASAPHVVLGAAGGTGSAVVRELVTRGIRVRAVTRSGPADVPEGVEQVAADIATPDGPMTEQTPQRAEGPNGRTRIEMAAAILRAHTEGRLRCTIGRSSDYYGPRGTATTAGDNI